MLLAALLLVQCSVHQIEFFMAAPCRREKKQPKKQEARRRSGEKIGGRYVRGIDYTYILVY